VLLVSRILVRGFSYPGTSLTISGDSLPVSVRPLAILLPMPVRELRCTAYLQALTGCLFVSGIAAFRPSHPFSCADWGFVLADYASDVYHF